MGFKSGDKVIIKNPGVWYAVGEIFTLKPTQNFGEGWWCVEGFSDIVYESDFHLLVEKPGLKSLLKDGDHVFTTNSIEFLKIGAYLVGIGERRVGYLNIDEFTENGIISENPQFNIAQILRPRNIADFTKQGLGTNEYEYDVIFDMTREMVIARELERIQQQIDELKAQATELSAMRIIKE